MAAEPLFQEPGINSKHSTAASSILPPPLFSRRIRSVAHAACAIIKKDYFRTSHVCLFAFSDLRIDLAGADQHRLDPFAQKENAVARSP
jgi:hypothetical protein